MQCRAVVPWRFVCLAFHDNHLRVVRHRIPVLMLPSRLQLLTASLLLVISALNACGTSDNAERVARTADTTSRDAMSNASRDPSRNASSNARAADVPVASPLQQVSVTTVGDTLADSVLIQRADKGRIIGRADAMWVVMISDFQCPYCKQWHDESMANLKRDYIDNGKVRMAYLHLPLSIHRHARAQAEASMCAAVQDKFWEYSERLFSEQRRFQRVDDPGALLSDLAGEVRLDMPSFKKCVRSDAIRMLVENDERQAVQAKVQSTPSFLIGDFLVQGALPYKDFKRAVDTALVLANSRKSR